MGFQNTVYRTTGRGLPGEGAFDTPIRATPGVIDPAAAAANCVIGRYFTKSRTTGLYRPGGDTEAVSDLIFGGIAGSPKDSIAYGVLNDPFAPSLSIRPGDVASFYEMYTPWVKVPGPCKEGDVVAYDTLTGELYTYAPGATIPDGRLAVPNAVIYRLGTDDADGGIVCVKLTN